MLRRQIKRVCVASFCFCFCFCFFVLFFLRHHCSCRIAIRNIFSCQSPVARPCTMDAILQLQQSQVNKKKKEKKQKKTEKIGKKLNGVKSFNCSFILLFMFMYVFVFVFYFYSLYFHFVLFSDLNCIISFIAIIFSFCCCCVFYYFFCISVTGRLVCIKINL